MPFELARFNAPNIAAIVAMALMPLIALPMVRNHSAATNQAVVLEQAERHAAAVGFVHDIAD